VILKPQRILDRDAQALPAKVLQQANQVVSWPAAIFSRSRNLAQSWAFSGLGVTKENAPLTLLFLIFLVLKLTHVIGWSWWWITAPVWIPTLCAMAFAWMALTVYKTAKGKSK